MKFFREKLVPKRERDMREMTPGELCAEIAENMDFLPAREEILEVLGNQKESSMKEWSRVRSEKLIYDIWTKEYIEKISGYITERANELGGTKENPVVILEAGAGNGKLTYNLRKQLDELSVDNVSVVACDTGEFGIKQDDSVVETMSHKEAIEKYKPNIIIFSWMPPGYDCTDDFREAESVDEYILIGETNYGCCGDQWKTWGFDPMRENNAVPPHEEDGFTRTHLKNLSRWQVAHFDMPFSLRGFTSTESFTRNF